MLEGTDIPSYVSDASFESSDTTFYTSDTSSDFSYDIYYPSELQTDIWRIPKKVVKSWELARIEEITD